MQDAAPTENACIVLIVVSLVVSAVAVCCFATVETDAETDRNHDVVKWQVQKKVMKVKALSARLVASANAIRGAPCHMEDSVNQESWHSEHQSPQMNLLQLLVQENVKVKAQRRSPVFDPSRST